MGGDKPTAPTAVEETKEDEPIAVAESRPTPESEVKIIDYRKIASKEDDKIKKPIMVAAVQATKNEAAAGGIRLKTNVVQGNNQPQYTDPRPRSRMLWSGDDNIVTPTPAQSRHLSPAPVSVPAMPSLLHQRRPSYPAEVAHVPSYSPESSLSSVSLTSVTETTSSTVSQIAAAELQGLTEETLPPVGHVGHSFKPYNRDVARRPEYYPPRPPPQYQSPGRDMRDMRDVLLLPPSYSHSPGSGHTDTPPLLTGRNQLLYEHYRNIGLSSNSAAINHLQLQKQYEGVTGYHGLVRPQLHQNHAHSDQHHGEASLIPIRPTPQR